MSDIICSEVNSSDSNPLNRFDNKKDRSEEIGVGPINPQNQYERFATERSQRHR
ncbi:MAG: hypothetical protein PHU97_02570 [Bacteroidales bacterium]|nr:hypothetical protein [Bacteroidales bacterium]MDD2322111.1 hypothetical protein [Bacteroidales bacterium]MDD3010185.1 hypothetical protein [Bacteroidales bacterium]MDY0286143.1 hypothetical protein [Bacteroidales bacterium]